MKHPKFRCRDILYMDKDAIKELYSFVWEACESLPFFSDIVDIEQVGSYAFGNNKLSSDADFNIALADYNHQIPAKQWWYTYGNRRAVKEKLMEFEKQYGLNIDLGVVDPNSIKYNVIASTKKFELYNRGRDPLPEKVPGIVQHYPIFSDKPFSVVNILDFDPAKDTAPPIFDFHLRFEPYAYYFLAEVRQWPRRTKFAFDEWASEVPYWQERYGAQFQTYSVVNGELIADT